MVEETPKKKAWGDDSDSDDSGAVSKLQDLKPDFVETKTPVAEDDSVKMRVITSPRNRTPMASPKNMRSPVGSPKCADRVRSPMGSPKSVGSRSANSSPDRDRRGRGGKGLSQVDSRRRSEGIRDGRDQFRGGGRGDFHGSTTRDRLPLGGGDVRGDARQSEGGRGSLNAGREPRNEPRDDHRGPPKDDHRGPSKDDHRGARNEGRAPLRLEHGTGGAERTPRGRDTPKKPDEVPAETPRSYQKLQLLPRSTSSDPALTSQASKLFGEAKPRELVLAARKEKDKSTDGDDPASPASSASGAVGEVPSLSPLPVAQEDEAIPANEPAVVRKFSGRGGRGRGNPMFVETNLARNRSSQTGDEEAPDSARSVTSSRGREGAKQGKGRNEESDASRSVSRESRVREGPDSARSSFSKVGSEDDRSGSKKGTESRGSFSRPAQPTSRESSRSASRGTAENHSNDDPIRSTSLSRGTNDEATTSSLSRVKSSEELKTRGTGRGIQSAGDVRAVSGRGRGAGATPGDDSDSSRGRTKNWGRGGCAAKVDVKEPKDKDVKDKDKEAKSPLNRFEALAEDESDH